MTRVKRPPRKLNIVRSCMANPSEFGLEIKEGTNFTRITESPKKLAEWIYDLTVHCRSENCAKCELIASDACLTPIDLTDWLQEECDGAAGS